MMIVRIKFFAVARDIADCSEADLSLKDGVSAAHVLDALIGKYPRLQEWKESLRLAVNCEYVSANHIVQNNDEIAIIPPVSGG